MELTVDSIRAFFRSYKPNGVSDGGLTRAGVLVVFFQKNHELHLLLTKRTEDVEHHKGQISFPGGAVDTEDQGIEATALREAEEEIGLSPEAVELFGRFDDFTTPTGFVITPVVGFIQAMPSLRLNPAEVESVLEVPVWLFLEKKNERVEQREVKGKTLNVYFYDFGPSVIWGATAFIIRSLLSTMMDTGRSSPAERPPSS